MEISIIDEDGNTRYNDNLLEMSIICTICHKTNAGVCYITDRVYGMTIDWKFICKECQK